MDKTDRQMDGQKQRLLPPSLCSGHNKNEVQLYIYGA